MRNYIDEDLLEYQAMMLDYSLVAESEADEAAEEEEDMNEA